MKHHNNDILILIKKQSDNNNDDNGDNNEINSKNIKLRDIYSQTMKCNKKYTNIFYTQTYLNKNTPIKITFVLLNNCALSKKSLDQVGEPSDFFKNQNRTEQIKKEQISEILKTNSDLYIGCFNYDINTEKNKYVSCKNIHFYNKKNNAINTQFDHIFQLNNENNNNINVQEIIFPYFGNYVYSLSIN